MAIFSQYGTGQRIGFAIICVGFFLCFSGSIAPYWITAETSVKDLMHLDEFSSLLNVFGLGDIKLFKINVGIWWYCVDTVVSDEKCFQFYDTSDYKGPDHEEMEDKFAWINVARFAVVINIILSLACGLVACCRCMCCSGGRTICHGIMSFFAGAAGFSAFLIVYNNTNSLVNLPIVNTEYAWALSVYTLGSIMMVVASFFLCFGVPREQGNGMVLVPTSPGISVNVSNSSVSQYNAGGPIQSFEPLPNPAQLHHPTVIHPPPSAYPIQAAGYNPGPTAMKFGN